MRAKEAAKMLGGSIAIYAIMAACASSGLMNTCPDDGGEAQGNGSSGSGGSGGASGMAGSGSGSSSDGPSILDVLTDPVPNAKADVNQSGTRLKANYYAGSDGSKEFLFSFHDTQRNADCSFGTAADGTTRCIPSATTATYYEDAACTQPIAIVSRCAAATLPAYVSAPVGPSAPYPAPAHIFPLGSPANVGGAYQLGLVATTDGGACGPSGLAYNCTSVAASVWTALVANSTTYSVGAEVGPDAFVQATNQTEP